MKYLANPEATLITMWVTARAILHLGPHPQGELVGRLRPTDLTSGEGKALQSSIEVGLDLGLFQISETAVPLLELGATLADGGGWFDEFAAFASATRRLVMTQADRDSAHRSDVASALPWLLSRDWRDSHDAIKGLPGVVATNEQAVAFGRWARELGLARTRRGRIAPDPTTALRRDLATATPTRFRASEFVDLIGHSIPTGPRHRLTKAALLGEDQAEELEVYSAVGFAIKRLEQEGRLRTAIADDAADRLLFRFPGPQDGYVTLSHVEVVA